MTYDQDRVSLTKSVNDDYEEENESSSASSSCAGKLLIKPVHIEMLAEVVLLMTSLGGWKKTQFESSRAQHLLDCKGLIYYLVDANKDISDATDCKDRELFETWKSQGFLRVTKDDSGNETVVLPQVIIDGISVGDQNFLQDLEDDGDLDYIVARLLCPSCLNEKKIDETSCPSCKAEYKSIIPEEYVDTNLVRKFCQGYPCD